MRRPLLCAAGIAVAFILNLAGVQPGESPMPTGHLTVAAATAATPAPPPAQNLPPGAVKHPGEKCASTIQPPEYQGCPQTDPAKCTGTPHQIGECMAALHGFFNPSANLQPRNGVEACIVARENGGDYGRSRNSGHFGRYQFSVGLWSSYGGQQDWGYASPAEQDWVFVNTVNATGYRMWTPYDGC